MPTMYGPLDLVKNEIRNPVAQNLGSPPSSPVKGQFYFDSANNIFKWWDGTQWVSASGGAGAVPSDTVSTQAIGDLAAAGSSTLYSRGDHKHGEPAFGPSVAQTAFGAAKADGAAVTLARSDHVHGTPVHDAAAHAAISLSALAAPTGALSLGGQLITNLATPVSTTDAATKLYVDNTAQGLDAKASVRAASTANIANIATGAPSTLDGVTLAANDRVLVKDQTTQSQNGIYTINTVGTGANGTWSRAGDMDSWLEVPSAYVWVEQGTTQADTGWISTADAGGSIGSTNMPWTQFSGAGQITAGAGLTKTGNTLDAVAGDTSLTVAADSIAVNTAVIATRAYADSAVATATTGMAKKFAAALTGTASPETVTHNLNTRDISLTVLNGASPYTAVEIDWDATTLNSAVIRYNPNLGAGYRVVVVG